MELVSVIIPYYKNKKFFQATIRSVIKQTYKKIEIIIIYDDKDPSDLEFIYQIKKMDKRIRLLVNKKNIGAGLSRNKGIKSSKGKFIAFIDSDDLWRKDKLKNQINFMKKKKSSISSTSYSIIDENDNQISLRKSLPEIDINYLIKSCDIGLSTVVFEKKVLNKNILFPNLKTKEDFVFWLKILRKNKCKILGLDQNLTKWRKTNNSLSSNFLQKMFDGYRVYKYHLNFNSIKSLIFLFLLSFNFLRKKFISYLIFTKN